MALNIARGLFIICCLIMGAIWGQHLMELQFEGESIGAGTQWLWQGGGGFVGLLAALIVLFGLRFITQDVFERAFPAVIAIVLALIMGYFASQYVKAFVPALASDVSSRVYLTSTLVLLFGFAGISLGLTRASSWEALISAVKKRTVQYLSPKIVDTSALIDGRVADIVQTGFLEGTLIVPRFVLKELQHIADSTEELRRNKGRRGLEVLQALQAQAGRVEVVILDEDPPNGQDVDAKILALAREHTAKVVTTDFNLNKVAQIEGLVVLNVNDLSNGIKSTALPDESFSVKIVKEGKESHQGVGYLDDGTMVVVDEGSTHVGEEIAVIVTSVLQTDKGRMLFARILEAA